MSKNKNYKDNILFICHESSRTGAPIFLLSFIRWIKHHTNRNFIILIDKGGNLEDEFQKLGKVIIIRPMNMTIFQMVWYKCQYKSYMASRIKAIKNKRISLIYGNTVINGKLSAFLKKEFNTILITHVHELKSVISAQGIKNMNLIKQNTFQYIAASKAVKNTLIDTCQIPEYKIKVFHECIEEIPEDILKRGPLQLQGVNKGDFIVGGAGFVDYRKGFDLFLTSAELLINKYHQSTIKFIWLGAFGRGRKQEVERFITEHDLGRNVFFPGEIINPLPYFMSFDLFYLTSREDPFPLVMLENGLLGKPVIGFKKTGGLEEFIGMNQELLIEPFNILQAVQLIMHLKENPAKKAELGSLLRQRTEEKYLMETRGKDYYRYLENLMT